MRTKKQKAPSRASLKMMNEASFGTRALIQYIMEDVYTDDAMDRFLLNRGSSRETNNAPANASNHIFLNGTTQSVPYPVLHDLSADLNNTNIPVLIDSDETSTLTSTGGKDFDLTVTVVGTSTIRPTVATSTVLDVSASSIYKCEFDAVVNSGTPILTSIYIGGSIYAVNHAVVNGTNSFEIANPIAGTNSRLRFDGTNLFDISVTNWTVKEITIPTASYLTILQADGTIKQLSSTGDVGENLVSNGDFSDGTTDWTSGSGAILSEVSGQLNMISSGGDAYFYAWQMINTVVGRRYSISVDAVSSTSTELEVGTSVGNASLVNSGPSSTPRTITATFIATTTTTYVQLVSREADVTAIFDNVVTIEALPISTTYSETASHQFVFNHTSQLSAADKAAIEADPNLIFRVWFNAEVLPSGFAKADMGNFFGGNEGLASGAYVQDLSGTFSRADTATYIDDNNVMQTAIVDELRLQDGVILIENEGTNELLDSGDFSTANWVATNTVPIHGQASIDEGTSASKIKCTTSVKSVLSIHQAHTPTSGITYTYSIYAKYGEVPDILMIFGGNGYPTDSAAEFNILNGTVTTTGTGLDSADIVELGDWYKISITATSDATASGNNSISISTGLSDDSSGSYFCFAQLEEHASATSYIPTTTTSETRAADVLPSAEIQAYDTATRTTLANQSNGTTGLKLIQDGSGRTTATVTDNTTQWKQGANAPTGWTVTPPYTITEIIGADTYAFTSDLNRYKNGIADGTFTAPVGVWTLGELAFDGATPTPSRGKTELVTQVIVP